MIAKKIIAIALFVISFTGLKAQDKFLNNSSETKEISQKVTELFKENKVHEAFNLLRPYWPLPENEVYGMEDKTIKSLNIITDRFGKPEDIVKVNEKTIKDFAILETYLVKFKNSAIRLTFVYYKNKKGWIINSFKWDDDFGQEFK